MNVERLRKLRDVIAESKTYDQSDYFHGCGTPACLAGHAAVLAHGTKRYLSKCGRVMATLAHYDAKAWLDLTSDQSMAMFSATPMDDLLTEKDDALAMLDRAIETGEVRWGE